MRWLAVGLLSILVHCALLILVPWPSTPEAPAPAPESRVRLLEQPEPHGDEHANSPTEEAHPEPRPDAKTQRRKRPAAVPLLAESEPSAETRGDEEPNTSTPVAEPARPTPVAEPAPSGPSTGALMAYAGQVSRLIAVERRYPAIARRRRLTGTAVIAVKLRHDREQAAIVGEPRIHQSSQHPALDQEALRMVVAAAPFPSLPTPLEHHELRIPVRFQLR